MITGRIKEKSKLNNMLQSDQAEFLIVHGRRRIGKTFLIESFFGDKPCLFFHIVGVQKGTSKEHLKEFSKEIGRVFYGGIKTEVSANWMDAFEALQTAIQHEKQSKPIILFFDEFPWLATPKSHLLKALEYYWNRYWKNDSRIKLIICGSSAAWLIKKIIHNKGGLHNRITQQINLRAFNLIETKQFLEDRGIQLNLHQVLELYYVMGGVPYYINQIQKHLSVAENINQLCFQKEGLLFDEFNKLFSSLFENAESYVELIRLIGKSRHGVSREEIEKKIKLTKKGGTLSQRLRDLEMTGFIKQFLPVYHSKKGIFYRILDEYSLFYLQWIEQEKYNIDLEIEHNNFWLENMNTPHYQSWRGYAFESVCYKHVAEIKKALNIRIGAAIGAWRYQPKINRADQGAQIDLLFDRADNAITLCEIKSSEKPFIIDKAYAENLKNKTAIFRQITRTKKQIFLVIIATNGLKQNEYAKELIANSISVDDMFCNA